VSELLYIRKYRVINSTDAESAMQILSSYPEIRLVLIDYDLPDKDGCELCREIRRKFAPDYLSIIGFIPEHEKKIGARFIKSGANDFVSKHSPFLVEEFYCRVSQCIETLRLFERIRRGAMEDFLTGLANRRCFFERGSQLFADCQESGRPLSCVMVDIDFFKKINDNYGHAVGDLVIKKMASMLRENAAASDIVCRFGGEEFCILIPDSSRDQVVNSCEKMRARISQVPAAELADKTTLQATVSIGICAEIGSSLESMINTADTLLYQAKAGGRNRVESVPL
jgi:diguanylate cyclase (GGDEF)-like protein